MVSVQHMWDLFEMCKGNANWMMNILLNESAEKHGDSNGEEDFTCNCDNSCWPAASAESPESVIVEEEEVVTKESANRPQPQRQRRKPPNQRQLGQEAEQIKRQIEESVVIGDEFYTTNMKRVRDWKSKKRNPAMITPTSEETEASSSAVSPPEMVEDEDDEEVEPDSEEDRKVSVLFLKRMNLNQRNLNFNCHSLLNRYLNSGLEVSLSINWRRCSMAIRWAWRASGSGRMCL